jgi:hypothetical protein
MTPQTPYAYTGDQAKAEVGLGLLGLTTGGFYLLGDRLEGEITVVPLKDMALKYVVLQLDYVMEGALETATINAKRIHLPMSKTLKGGELYRFPVKLDYRFPRPSYKGKSLNSYWRLRVFLDYDGRQYDQSFISKVSQVFTGDPRHGTSFEIWVKYGKGAYVVAPQELPTDLIESSSFLMFGFLTPFIFSIAAIAAGEPGWWVIAVLILVVFICWLLVRLSIFQMTPMEIQPLRDGQLRLRILDRGNDQLKGAMIGYRFLEHFVEKNGDHETAEKKTLYRKIYPFGEVSRREEYFYEAILPWPETDLPTSGISGRIGYEWEVFLLMPNPLTGGMHEKSWPIEVSRELFRLAPPTEEELEQEGLEVLKLKELEYLPKRVGR